ncbi:hypothetical protein EGR_06809 [Echinococcus granulosus]|uniref:Uncharacterized protein n=1 Tax=Echinococcus granulosus TaxID=6210 RepID=W6UJH9_ECHGR|nr:hypothetical protein EGR_06809 [Echinococcus granulosus]EUB58282.1 hypothetical protein EGR_06809 [Echinococcus granulosus]
MNETTDAGGDAKKSVYLFGLVNFFANWKVENMCQRTSFPTITHLTLFSWKLLALFDREQKVRKSALNLFNFFTQVCLQLSWEEILSVNFKQYKITIYWCTYHQLVNKLNKQLD